MSVSIKNRLQAAAWQKSVEKQAPRVGELAPDFELHDLHGENPVRLSQFQGQKPVALLFGSYT